MKLNQWRNIFQVILNENSIEQHVIQIKHGIIKHVNVSVDIILNAKNIIVGVLEHLFVKIVSI